MKVAFYPPTCRIDQDSYTNTIIEEHNLQGTTPKDTPGVQGEMVHSDSHTSRPLSKLLGMLQWLGNTRPDISYATNHVSQSLQNPTTTSWRAATRIVQYLSKHRLGLDYCASTETQFQISTYTDASFNVDTSALGHSGYLIYLNSNLVAWKSTKQRLVTKSTTESEYEAIKLASTTLQYITNLLQDLDITCTKRPIFCDNQSTLAWLRRDAKVSNRNRHMRLTHCYVRQLSLNNIIQPQFIPTKDQLADILTKHLTSSQHHYLLSKLGLFRF